MSKLKCFFQTATQPKCASFGILALRLIVGAAFVFHGWGKMQAPFSWMPPEAPVPGFLQFLAAFAEFGGGIAWILGFLTPLASFGIFCTMSVAVFMHLVVRHDPFVNLTGGMSYEPALVYWGVAILFFLVGAGKFSVDRFVFGERS